MGPICDCLCCYFQSSKSRGSKRQKNCEFPDVGVTKREGGVQNPACDTATVTWSDRILALVVVVLLFVGGGILRRHRGRAGYLRYGLAWISVWVVLLLVLIAAWIAISRQVIH